VRIDEAAIHYLRAGLCVLPALLREKRPALAEWKSFQSRLPREDELRAWFDRAHDMPDAALCVLTGATSGNVELIDFDQGGEAFPAWRAIVERESPGLYERLVVERSQSGGRHVIYRCREPVCGNLHLAQRSILAQSADAVSLDGRAFFPRRRGNGGWEVVVTLIETRGEGGLFLCAPSPGYILEHGSIAALPVLTSDERDVLLGAAASLNQVTPAAVGVPDAAPASGDRPGDAFNAHGDVSAVLRQHGWMLHRDGENQYWRRPGKSHGWSATLKDRVFYVHSTSAAPFDAGRAYGPFAVYSLLEHGGDYRAAASALRAQGFGSIAPTVTASVVQPSPMPPASDTTLRPVSVRELMCTFPALRPPVIHGLLRRGETMNVISAPKVGKSWLVLDLALAIATGRDWLGQFRCERGEVLILDNELHGETSSHRVPRVAEARQIPLDAYADRVFVQNLRGHLRDVFSLGGYFRSLEPGRYRAIILDAFYRFMPRDTDENDNGTMASVYNTIDRYANDLGCSFILIHHTSKGVQAGKSVTDVGAGAGSQSRATDTHLVLRQHEEDDAVVLDAAVRSWPPVVPRCLRWSFPVFTPADELDPELLRIERPRRRKPAEPDPSDPPEEDPRDMSVAEFAHRFVSDEPRSTSDIVEAAIEAGCTRRSATQKLKAAEERGMVHRWFYGRNRQRLALHPQPKQPTQEMNADARHATDADPAERESV
jgi:hypothetical protein